MTECRIAGIESLLQPYENGVTLVRPDQMTQRAAVGHSLASLLKLPLNIYAYDFDNRFQFCNDQSSEFCGFTSNLDAIGRHLNEIAVADSAKQLIQNNLQVIRANACKIVDEELERLDGFYNGASTFKFPWYSTQKSIIGVFGFSIPWRNEGKPNITEALSLLMNMGLLNAPGQQSKSVFPGAMIDNDYFTKRQNEILFHVVRGKSAKEIARVLSISHRTIETHISNIKNTLGVNTRSELIEKVYHYF